MSTASPSPEKKSFPVLSPNGHRAERGSASSTPNQHPYAIKTTSTALLTRSNSTGYTSSHQHVYIPSTPSPAPKHRHTKSDLSRSSPRPLPIPPSLESPTKGRKGHGYTSSEDMLFPSLRARADTLPSAPSPSPPSPVKVDELPSNPRVWTTSQLASYLITALRVRSGESLPLPLPVAKDIAAFVKEARLNGRAFLRLNEQDLESMGINNLWREALLNASRNLRQNVLKGRIWGFEADGIAEPSRNHPYRSSYNLSSSSVDEISGSQETTPHKSGDRKGRVRGLVASLERTSSSGSGFSNHGSSTSEGDIIPSTWADEDAAFASGSEASDVEDRKARAMTKKRILLEPIISPVDIIREPQGKIDVALPEAEPSVEELLASGSMSGSWGAKAWEDMNVGETVKRISVDHGNENVDAYDDIFGRSGNSSRLGSGKDSDKNSGDARKQIKDIIARPLPSRPLPSPPKEEASSPAPQTPVIGQSVQIVKRENGSMQANAKPLDLADVRARARDTGLASEGESERLQQALSLLELFRQRLADVEEKLSILEQKDVEQAQVGHQSQGIETDTIPAAAAAPVPVPVLLMESRSIQVEGIQAAANGSPSSESKSVQVDGGGDTSQSSSPSALISRHSPTSADDTDHSAPPRSDDEPDWRRYLDGREWDPLENGIRSYVLMVSFGVCTVVLSTILKRLAGKKS